MKEIDQHPAYSPCLEAFLQNIRDRRLSDYTLPPGIGALVLAYHETYGGGTQQLDDETNQFGLNCALGNCSRDRLLTTENNGVTYTEDEDMLGDSIMPKCLRSHRDVVVPRPTDVADVIAMPKKHEGDDPTPPPIAA